MTRELVDPAQTIKRRRSELSEIRGATLCVLLDDASLRFALPRQGEVTLGRAADNDVVINHESISRHHAILTVLPRGESGMQVRDLDSANGTTLGETALSPKIDVDLALHEMVVFGDVAAFVETHAPAIAARRIQSHEYLEDRIREECVHKSEQSFGLLQFKFNDDANEGAWLNTLIRVLGDAKHCIARHSPKIIEILLIGATAERCETLARLLADALPHGCLDGQMGLAMFPRDGRDADSILNAASLNRSGFDDGSSDRILSDPAMKKIYGLAQKLAKGPISILLLGETGSGKEILAEAIHRASPRSRKKFVRINCAAISPSLFEAELFGYEKGAFTGASKSKMGLLEDASGGTVFLDEIGEIPMDAQVKLLRVLEERKVRPVGGLETRDIDVRLVAATHRDLEQCMATGSFREDFYYRVAGVSLSIPPLRQRQSEIVPLMRLFMSRVCKSMALRMPDIDDDSESILMSYIWPGNIRELRNVAERAVLLSEGGTIRREHLPMEKMSRVLALPTRPDNASLGQAASSSDGVAGENERTEIIEALRASAGNQSKAAKTLGISRRTLGTRMDKWGIPRPRKS